jgi:hypothetical protein
MAIGGRASYIVAGLLIGALVCGPAGRLEASEGSKGSNDSSKSSTDSSNSSTDSSNKSENSTEGSPRESTQGTTDGTSDSSAKRRGAVIISVALLIIAVGASAMGVVRALAQAEEQPRLQMLARFLQRNHALVTRDVMMGEGPMLSGWTRGLGLTAAERERLGRALAGSAEQAQLLAALDGPIDEARARRFATGFAQLGRRALGPARFRDLALAGREIHPTPADRRGDPEPASEPGYYKNRLPAARR